MQTFLCEPGENSGWQACAFKARVCSGTSPTRRERKARVDEKIEERGPSEHLKYRREAEFLEFLG